MHHKIIAALLLAPLLAHAQSVQIRVREVGADDVKRLVERKSYGPAREVAIQCADKTNDPNCQLHAGELLIHGLGGPKDEARAATYIEASARQGSPAAQALLGNLYYHGMGVPRDRTQTVKWWTESANNCNLWAQNALAQTFFRGEHVPKDPTLALHWVSVAAHYGFEPAKPGVPHVEGVASSEQRTAAKALTSAFVRESGCGRTKPVVVHEP